MLRGGRGLAHGRPGDAMIAQDDDGTSLGCRLRFITACYFTVVGLRSLRSF